jgi:hypothetical protein
MTGSSLPHALAKAWVQARDDAGRSPLESSLASSNAAWHGHGTCHAGRVPEAAMIGKAGRAPGSNPPGCMIGNVPLANLLPPTDLPCSTFLTSGLEKPSPAFEATRMTVGVPKSRPGLRFGAGSIHIEVHPALPACPWDAMR